MWNFVDERLTKNNQSSSCASKFLSCKVPIVNVLDCTKRMIDPGLYGRTWPIKRVGALKSLEHPVCVKLLNIRVRNIKQNIYFFWSYNFELLFREKINEFILTWYKKRFCWIWFWCLIHFFKFYYKFFNKNKKIINGDSWIESVIRSLHTYIFLYTKYFFIFIFKKLVFSEIYSYNNLIIIMISIFISHFGFLHEVLKIYFFIKFIAFSEKNFIISLN